MHALSDHQNLVHSALDSAWCHEDVLSASAVTYRSDLSGGEAARKDAIVAGCVKPFSGLDLLLILDIRDFALGIVALTL